MKEMIQNKIGIVSNIKNVMRHFNINQVERKIDTTKKYTYEEERYNEKRYYDENTYEREERCTNVKRYTSIYVGRRYES